MVYLLPYLTIQNSRNKKKRIVPPLSFIISFGGKWIYIRTWHFGRRIYHYHKIHSVKIFLFFIGKKANNNNPL